MNARLKRNMRTRIYDVLKASNISKNNHTSELIGCSIDFLKTHLESQFKEGMTWENYGKWHVDHIIPCFTFDLTDPTQQKKCFHYTNLRPLWAWENLSRKRDDIPTLP
jgi:hypothetical protein